MSGRAPRQKGDTMGMQRLYPNTSLHEILQIAGLPTDNLPDYDVYVTAMPTTRAQAMELLDGYHGIKLEELIAEARH